MKTNTFTAFVLSIAFLFTGFFCVSVIPALISDFDVIGAFAAGFVNPYSSGYSADVIACWCILAVWIWYERTEYNISYGWVCLVLGLVPGVAVGFALYLVLRQRHFRPN